MLKRLYILGFCLSLGMFFGLAPTRKLLASELPTPTNQFLQIEQPLWLKAGVALGGISLVGLELWWFLLSKTKAQQARPSPGTQEIEITVDGGYTPDRVVVRSGQPVRLNFLRKDPSDCLERVLLPDFNRSELLKLDEMTSVEFTPNRVGTYSFHCGMNMFHGTILVTTD